MKYDYPNAVKESVMDYIWENFSDQEIASKLVDSDTKADFENYLEDVLWANDDVTGNASGSFTMSRDTAYENLRGNEDELAMVIKEWCTPADEIAEHFLDPEYWDVSIRCYYLTQGIWEAIEALEDNTVIAALVEQMKGENNA